MEFGYYIRPADTYEGMVEMARYAEELGLFGVFLNDHVHSMRPGGMEPYLEAWTAMAGIGVETKRIRLGHIVLFNSLNIAPRSVVFGRGFQVTPNFGLI